MSHRGLNTCIVIFIFIQWKMLTNTCPSWKPIYITPNYEKSVHISFSKSLHLHTQTSYIQPRDILKWKSNKRNRGTGEQYLCSILSRYFDFSLSSENKEIRPDLKQGNENVNIWKTEHPWNICSIMHLKSRTKRMSNIATHLLRRHAFNYLFVSQNLGWDGFSLK